MDQRQRAPPAPPPTVNYGRHRQASLIGSHGHRRQPRPAAWRMHVRRSLGHPRRGASTRPGRRHRIHRLHLHDAGGSGVGVQDGAGRATKPPRTSSASMLIDRAAMHVGDRTRPRRGARRRRASATSADAGAEHDLRKTSPRARQRARAGPSWDSANSGSGRSRAAPSPLHIVDIEVDPETGKIEILRYTAAAGFGERRSTPATSRGRYRAAWRRASGWALNEEYCYERRGQRWMNSQPASTTACPPRSTCR